MSISPDEMSPDEMSSDDGPRSEFSQASSTARAAARAHQERLVTGESELMGLIVSGLNAYIANNDTYVREEHVDERALRIIHAAEESGLCGVAAPGTFSAEKYMAQCKLDGARTEILQDHPDQPRVVIMPITYKKSMHGPIGRYFASAEAGRQSMQRCRGATRAHLVKGHLDLDQVNAILELARQIFEQLGFAQPCFLEYIDRRDVILETMLSKARIFVVNANGKKQYNKDLLTKKLTATTVLMSRGIAKKLFLTMLHGGSSKAWMEENNVEPESMETVDEDLHGFPKRYEAEVKRLLRVLYKHPNLSSFNAAYDAYQAHKGTDGHPGVYAALLFQSLESMCFLATDRALPDFGFPNGHAVWAFDGGMIRGSDDQMTAEILAGLSAAVKKQTGLSIQLKVKPADLSVSLAESIGSSTARNDLQAATFLGIVEHDAIVNVCDTSEQLIWFYNNASHLWASNNGDFHALIKQADLVPFLAAYSTMANKGGNMYTKLTGQTDLRAGVYWTQELNRGLVAGEVPFANHIYNVLTHETRPIRSEDMLTLKLKESAPKSHETYELEVAEVTRVLNEIFPEEGLRNHVLERIAESLFTPANPHKYFVQLVGSGNNAKSFLFNILSLVFPEWVIHSDPKNFIIQNGQTNALAATPWLIDLMGARIVVTEEPPAAPNAPGGAVSLNGNFLKLVRGGNKLTGRRLNKNNITFTPGFTFWVCTNKLVNITPHDQAISDSFVSYQLPSVFLGETKLAEAKRGEGQNAYHEFLYLRDDSLKAKFERRSYKMALLHILAGFFRTYTKRGRFTDEASTYVLDKSVYEEAVAPTLHEMFLRMFIITKLPSDKTPPRTTQKEILAILEANGFPPRSNKELTFFLQKRFKNEDRFRKPKNVPTWIGVEFDPDFYADVTADNGDGGGGGI